MNANVESQAEIDLEYQINVQALRLATLTTVEGRREANEELCRLVKLRSPERVAEMEAAKGLR